MKERIRMFYPNHPLFTVPEEKLKMWRNANIRGNKYGPVHCKQVVQVLEEIWYFSDFSENILRRVTKNNFLQF